MACYHPLSAFRSESGDISFVDRGGDPLRLPCGRCIGCRLERARQWATRIMFESQMHDSNSFLTLTYSSDCLPDPPVLVYDHFQRFMKRLRKQFSVRFYMCGEYGDINERPHYHCCLFGCDFSSDRVFHKMSDSGFPIYTSATLNRLWPYGHAYIGDLTFESAGYVARYCLKKITGQAADDHYRRVNPDTGEIYDLVPEFAHMSLKPGIGAEWLDKRLFDVYAHDHVIVRGRRCKPPRYFDKKLKKYCAFLFDDVKVAREFDAYQVRADSTDDRLAVREKVKLASMSNFKLRSFDHG